MKNRYYALILIISLVVTSCTIKDVSKHRQVSQTDTESSEEPAPGTQTTEQVTANDESPSPETTPNGKSMIAIRPISRHEAGLETIPKLDFSKHTLNPRINELLLEGKPYTDEDMQKGIIEPFFITERFKDPVIDNISIGTGVDEVIRQLGEPSFRNENAMVYKTNRYYLCIRGTDSVELIDFAVMPETYPDNEILNKLLVGLCEQGIYLTDLLDDSPDVSDFFDAVGFIHGGGNYAESASGVLVDTLSGEITVYNNFEGNLYGVTGDSDLKVIYSNTDYNIESLLQGAESYIWENESFAESGKSSPSGKYIAKYDYVTSESHYFTIRSSDYSFPDYQLGAVAKDFEWLNDDYILYTSTFTTLPTVMRVTRDPDKAEYIRLMQGVDELDYDYGSSDYDFSIESINDNVIILWDNNADFGNGEAIRWAFPYHMDSNGRFVLDLGAASVSESENEENSEDTVQQKYYQPDANEQATLDAIAADLAAKEPFEEPASPDESGYRTVTAGNTLEFIEAIKPDTIIVLTQDSYDLTEAMESQITNPYVSVEWAYDGNELFVNGVDNLIVKSASNDLVDIVTRPQYGNVITFNNSSNIRIQSVRAGHSPDTGYCTGGVFVFNKCTNISIHDSVLYGCGTEGLTLSNVNGLRFENSTVGDCSYSIMTAGNCKNIVFVNSNFTNNEEFNLFTLGDCENVVFEGCSIDNNRGDYVFMLENVTPRLIMRNTTVSGNSADYFQQYKDEIYLFNVTFENNDFSKYEFK